MNAILTALGEPYAWTSDPSLRTTQAWQGQHPSLSLVHPGGQVIHIYTVSQVEGPAYWLVKHLGASGTLTDVVRFRKHAFLYGVKSFQKDLDRAFGPMARARIEDLIERMRLACLTHGLSGTFHANANQSNIRIWGPLGMHDAHDVLPPDLQNEIYAARDLLHQDPNGQGLNMSDRLYFEVSSSMHARLHILDQAGQVEAGSIAA